MVNKTYSENMVIVIVVITIIVSGLLGILIGWVMYWENNVYEYSCEYNPVNKEGFRIIVYNNDSSVNDNFTIGRLDRTWLARAYKTNMDSCNEENFNLTCTGEFYEERWIEPTCEFRKEKI